MATYNARSINGIAAVATTGLLGHFCVFTSTARNITSGGTNLTAQGQVDGIVGEEVAIGKEVPVVIPDGGTAKIKLGATLAAGAVVATAADGRAVAHGAGNGDRAWGVLLQGGDANELVTMQFTYKGQANV